MALASGYWVCPGLAFIVPSLHMLGVRISNIPFLTLDGSCDVEALGGL
jgi:hypothetical protein